MKSRVGIFVPATGVPAETFANRVTFVPSGSEYLQANISWHGNTMALHLQAVATAGLTIALNSKDAMEKASCQIMQQSNTSTNLTSLPRVPFVTQ